jgi:hypothetical protein
VSGVTSPSPAAEEPKQTPEELIQDSGAQSADSGRDEPEAVVADERHGADDGETETAARDSSAEPESSAKGGPDRPAGPETSDTPDEPAASPARAALDVTDTPVEAVSQGSSPVDPTSTEPTSVEPTSIGPDAGLPDGDELGDLLRERLFQAVSGIEPRPGTLEYLRHAVPARRKRRQTALATTAVTVFAVTTAVTLAGRGSLGGVGSSDSGADVSNGMATSVSTSNAGDGSRGTGTGGAPHTPVLAYGTPTATTATTVPSHSLSFAEPPVGSPSSAANLPNCQNSSMSSVVPTAGPTVNGVSYETVTATAATACTIAGPPQLTVVDAAGAVSSKVPIFKADGIAAPGLAAVPTWGRTLVLKPGDRYQFQFAWVATACPPPPTTPPVGTPSSVPSTPPPSSASAAASDATSLTSQPPTTTPTSAPTSQPSPSQSSQPPSPSSFTVAYSVYGAQPIANATFTSTCGAAVYLTDLFQNGEYQAPHVNALVSQNPSPSS